MWVDVRFGKYEHQHMTILDFRKSLGLTQEQFAERLGLKSKGQISEIESTNQCSMKVALKLESLSRGAVNAASVCPAVALVREGRAA